MATIKGYHHISLSVTDLGKSSRWYRDVLGLDFEADIEGRGFRRTRLRVPESGMTLTLTSHETTTGGHCDEKQPGLDHVAFDVGGVRDVEAFRTRFDRLGIDHSGVKAIPNGSAFTGAVITLRDPDNVQLEIFGSA